MTSHCAAKLIHFDKTSNITADSAFSNSSDVINTAVGEKRYKRTPRKCKSLIEDSDQSDNVKKIKGDIKNTQCSKTESEKTITSQKDTKNIKIRASTSTKSSKNNSFNSDLNKIPSQSIVVGNKVPRKNASKRPKNKISKSLFSVKKKPLVNNVNKDDTPNELKRSCDFDTSKSPKKRTPTKLITSVTNYVNSHNSLNELERNANLVPSKNIQNKMSKSPNSIKNKTVAKNANKDDSLNEFEQSSDFVPSKLKTKTTKSITSVKNKSIEKKLNKSDTLNELERNDILSPKSKNKTTKSNSSDKKSLSNNVNKIDTPNLLEGSEDSVFSRKRGRRLKKTSLKKSDGIYADEVDLQPTESMDVLENYNDIQESELSQNFDDNPMMLRSNNKPPKIKKKWSEEWSGNKLLNNITLKSNNDNFSSNTEIDANICNKLAKKIMKTPKSKMSSNKKIKTKMLENPRANTNSSLLISNSNTCSTDTYNSVIYTADSFTADSCTKNNPGARNHDINFSENQCSFVTITDEVINATPVYFETEFNEPSSTKTSNMSEVTVVQTTYEPVSHSSYLSIPMLSSECPEISYGISILSEAISRQCNAEINKDLKTKSPENDVNEEKYSTNTNTSLGSSRRLPAIQSNAEINNDFKTKSPEKDINEVKSSIYTNSCLRSQVPSAMISPQRVQKNVSKKVAKHPSKLYENSVESEFQLLVEREIHLLSKRFNLPVDLLRKTVVEEPLSVFQKQYCESITSSMLAISPIVKNVEAKLKPNVTCEKGKVDMEYKVEPIRESAAYEKTNLKSLMDELSKTMPSWSLSIVTNPQRYVISHMSIGTYGVPFVSKAIVLDKNFRASVYINKILEYAYSKRYTTATEIVNLIKNLDSL